MLGDARYAVAVKATRVSTDILLWGVAVYVAATVAALAVGLRVLLALPPTYFVVSIVPSGSTRLTWRAIAARIARNAAGIVLVAIGVVLSLPGIPGQGLVTILVGVMLLDFPGRHRIERKVLGRPAVLIRINRLRARFGRPPIIAPLPDGD